MNIKQSRVHLLGLARVLSVGMLAALSAGCASSEEARSLAPAEEGDTAQEEFGNIQLSLVSEAASGTRYRLSDAVVMVEGPGTSLMLDTDTNPAATSLNADVPVGQYEAFLQAGWKLERLLEGGGAEVVDAELKSSNPVQFPVQEAASTRVAFRFRVGDEEVGPIGSFSVVLEVEEEATEEEEAGTAGCGNGVREGTEDCDGADTQSGFECDSGCRFVECGDGDKEGTEACDDGNTLNGDGCSSVCQVEMGGGTTCAECTQTNCSAQQAACADAVNGTKCTDVVTCFETSDCALGATTVAATVVEPCFCGTFGALDCAGGYADGPCISQARLAGNLTANQASVLNTLVRFDDPGFPIGDVKNLALCQIEFCGGPCEQY